NDELAEKLIPLLGGVDNIVIVDNCITRLRLEVKDNTLVQDAEIKKLGIAGVLKAGKTSVQVIVGTQVEFVANALKRLTGK
ncbi:MAG: glucose PTS transporter subunit EIIB, partial [Cetobacterium sp.]